VSIYRPSEQRVYVINDLGTNDLGLGAADYSFAFGNPGDKPFVGDFDGDGVDTIGLHRESSGLVYFRNSNTTGIADSQFIFGDPGDQIIAGDWIGAGKDTVAVYRPSTQTTLHQILQRRGLCERPTRRRSIYRFSRRSLTEQGLMSAVGPRLFLPSRFGWCRRRWSRPCSSSSSPALLAVQTITLHRGDPDSRALRRGTRRSIGRAEVVLRPATTPSGSPASAGGGLGNRSLHLQSST